MKRNVFAVLVLVLVLVSLLMMTGCGSGNGNPKKTVVNALEALKAMDKVKLESCFVELEDVLGFLEEELEDNEVLAAYFSHLDYKIISSNVSKDTAIVKAEISSLNFDEIFSVGFFTFMKYSFMNLFSYDTDEEDDELNQFLLGLIEKSRDKKSTLAVDIHLEKSKDRWIINNTNAHELQSAILGGTNDTF